MAYLTIEQYNTNLINNKENIDISFIDEFIKLVHKKDCCIHHDMLQNYGILTKNKTTNNVKILLEQNSFKENKDYLIQNVSHLVLSRTKYKNEYYLKSRTFKLCLMWSKNIELYALYYLLLEECIAYYKEYQDRLNIKYISKLKDKIIKKDKIIIEKNDVIHKLQVLLNILIKNHGELNESNNKLDNTTEELNDTSLMLEYFIIMKSDTNVKYTYYIICGKKKYINKKINLLEEYYKIKSIKYIHNSKLLWNLIKQNMKKYINCNGNKLNLVDINENTFLEKIDKIYNKKNIVKIDLEN